MRKESTTPVIMFWDLETSPMIVPAWSFYPNYINPSHMIEDTKIISGSWKILGKTKVYSATLFDEGVQFNDYDVVKKIHAAISEADILVAHNGDAFDLKRFNAKVIEHGLPPLPKLLTVDTLKEVKKVAKFSSHKLDFLGTKLLADKKIETTFSLWSDIMNGDMKAMKKMDKYCVQDVKLLEKLYIKLRPYMKGHPNIADFNTFNCPKCNASDMRVHKHRRTATGLLKRQYQCNTCGGYHTDRGGVINKPYSMK
jgi:predicted RNA-binding Zn-ribbon protein involved in translation (DUF1610 family)